MKITKEDLDHIEKNIDQIKNEISEKDIDYLYAYLNENYMEMTDEQKIFFAKILEQIDKDFYKDQENKNE